MAIDRKRFEKEAMQLPPKERARLAEHLIASLDQTDDTETERLWLEEAERRYNGYKAGHISTRPAKDVLRDVRKSLV
jgi:putative addiction module component (TIGR02574 family)